MRTHPYAEAVYEVVALTGGGFGVKVSISEASPAIVTSFETVAVAEAWVVTHKSRVQSQSQSRTVFRRPARSTATDG